MFPWNTFPFNKEVQEKMRQLKPEEVNQFVQNIMGKMFQSNFSDYMNPQEMMKEFQPMQQTNGPFPESNKVSNLKYSVYDTHDHIFVRIQIKSEEWLQQLKIYHTSNVLILENIPEYDDKHTISLPALVKRKGTTAHYKDEMLELKIPKNEDMQYSEIDITEVL